MELHSTLPIAREGLDSQDQVKIYMHCASILEDNTKTEELKLKAISSLTDHWDSISSLQHFSTFLDHAMRIFLKVLHEGTPLFISEYNMQQVRKQIVEIIYLLPCNDLLRPYVRQILTIMFKLMETENEEIVLVSLRTIIELHKQFRPVFNSEIHHFIQMVKNIYRDLPAHKDKIFEPKPVIKVKKLSDLDVDLLLSEIYTVTVIQTDGKKDDGSVQSYNLIPKGVMSLKVLQELPIAIVLMYQLYKLEVQGELTDFVPSVITTITMQPTSEQMTNPLFNKEIFVDFMGAQIKTLSFLAYIIRVYQNEVTAHATMMVKGILGMLQLCPMEVVHLRKELLVATRHILATDLRTKFVPYIEHLYDEDILLGRGWTTKESLRPLAYSTLADLVHHIRNSLSFSNLEKVIHLFSKNVHDESLPTCIHTMSCKLLLNLVDCVRERSDAENGRGKQLLMRMLQVFVLKVKTIAKLHLPVLIAKSKSQGTAQSSTLPDVKTEEQKLPLSESMNLTEKSKFGFPTSQTLNYTIVDTRGLVKTLVYGVKTITWGITSCKTTEDGPNNKQFHPKETMVFINLVKWAMQALDIYTLSVGPTGNTLPHTLPRVPSPQSVRTKEEKEALEYFAGVFSSMAPQTFHEIFSSTIDYIVERIYRNYALQIVGNSFLANSSTSPIFATILVEYLLERMEEMGSNLEKSNLYLKLFKLVFGSVSLFPTENEQMLRPHLHQIVNRSMELAMTAKEPYNYFLLLRALFRSIGGGCHDLLYQEFLPLLPNLLQGLNCLQSGLHKQHMKDLFVELCLTVPVRLSSLLPYLPMLMDPLVSALNGSHTLISQGLRTLELCVDNLQPDFLYEHIQPVRADLMQALWRTLRNPQDQVAHVAFRVLGKFGGGNRKMMIEPQKLEYNDISSQTTSLVVTFESYSDLDLPVQKIIDTAMATLKSSSSDPFYRKQAWEVIRNFLVASIQLDDGNNTLLTLFSHPAFNDGPIASHHQASLYKLGDNHARETHQTALTAVFVAAAIKELQQFVLPTMVAIVRHYTMVAVSQQAGPFTQIARSGMDPLVIVDALVTIMGHEEKELCKPGHFSLGLIFDTATKLLGSKERACQLPLMEYLSDRMVSLCYERAWYAKYGGCFVINTLFEKMTSRWVFDHLFVFLKALLFVMMDLTGEVSTGAIDMAKVYMEKMLTTCAAPIEPNANNADLINAQKKSLYDVIHELVRLIASSNTLVREQAMSSLTLIARIQGVTVTAVMEPHREVLADMVPPKKHLLRHQTVNAQIGIMEGSTFCTTLNPRLFTVDLGVMEHKVFFHEVLSLVENEDAILNKYPCYKNVTNLVPLRHCALRALSACHYIPNMREKIFNAFYNALEKPELQKVVVDCLRNFINGGPVDVDVIRNISLGDYRTLDLNSAKRLYYLTELFPNSFNEKFCEQLLQHLRKLFELLTAGQKTVSKNGENEQKIVTLINIFHKMPAASSKFCDYLTRLVLQTEKSLCIETSSPFREPLLGFLLRFPVEMVKDMFLNDNIKDPQWSRFFTYLLKHDKGKPFRDVVENSVPNLISLITSVSQKTTLSAAERHEVQYQGIHIVSLLVKHNELWLSSQKELAQVLKELWCSEQFHEYHRNVDTVDFVHWKEPKLLLKVLLHYFCHHPNEINLLFHLLRATCERYIPDFQFLRNFLESTVAQNYTVEWKRAAFFRFVDDFENPTMSQELKAKILQLVLIPCFAIGFERGEGEKLIGGPISPDEDNPDNVVSVFISRVIDPDNPFANTDAVRIALLQFSCFLVEQASPHIHDVLNKRQGQKLKRLMTFAWPCLLGKNCVDPSTRYHGHLLLSHIIAKFAIHKRIVLQVLHSLLKAHALEARLVVRQALEILTPAMPHRMDGGHKMLSHWTKKIIVEEGHNMNQLFHILFLVVKHFRVYYPVRHDLIQYMIQAIQKLGFPTSASMEQRKLAVELAEVIIKWELQRIKDESESSEMFSSSSNKRPSSDDPTQDQLRKRLATGSVIPTVGLNASVPKAEPNSSKPIEKNHADAVLNQILRLACQVNDATPTTNSQGELLSRRCVALLKTAMKPDLWPQPWDLKLAWFDKIFVSLESPTPNYGNICTALELLTFLLGVLKREQILANVKLMQKGLTTCITSTHSKIVRLTHAFLTKLMSMFPTEPHSSGAASQYEELEGLYGSIGKIVLEGLSNYEKSQSSSPNSLFGTIMILKAACTSNPAYIDRVITPFMRVLQRMHKDHIQVSDPNALATELLLGGLELVKNRLGAMQSDMRKAFIGTILVKLIEGTREVKVLKAITKMLDEWIKQPSIQSNHSPILKEKSLLLVKLMTYVERNFPDELELNAQFLEIVNYVYRDPVLKVSELAQKLEPAFLQGLRCVQPQIRAKFFEIFDASIKRNLQERLRYLIISQNWESIGAHYWIKQCIELVFITCDPEKRISLSTPYGLLPSFTSIINSGEVRDREVYDEYARIKREPSESGESPEVHENNDEIDLEYNSASSTIKREETPQSNRQSELLQLIKRQSKFLDTIRDVKSINFLCATSQLCHMDTNLAERIWLDLFPRIWNILSDRDRSTLSMDMVPFLCSGAHEIQKNCQPSALNTFVEALSRCDPPIPIRPTVMKYLGKTHNLWHRMTLNLEQLAYEQSSNETSKSRALDQYDFEFTNQHEVLDCLSEMYAKLCEQDMWAGLWQKHARYRETNIAIAFQQQGFFEQAQNTYETVMGKSRLEFSSTPAPISLRTEYLLWEEHWIRCSKELNQWDILLEYGNSRSSSCPMLVLESSWKIPNWGLMKDALFQVEQTCPKEVMWKIELYRGFLTICNAQDSSHVDVEKCVERASSSCMKEWRRLPHIVSHIHLPLLQAAQQIMELQEAAQIHQGLTPNRPSGSSLHDMKAIVKTWRNRLPVIADDLSHWSDIFTWRQHHYQFIASHYDSQHDPNPNHSMLGVHASAQAIIHFGKIARKHNLTSVCLGSLSRIYTIPSVPIVDCFQKIRQQVKCSLQMSYVAGKSELQEGLEVIESTNLKYFTKEMTAEFYALKGMLLAQSGRSEEANKAFSAAVQMQDTLVKAWALWGDYLEHVFTGDPSDITYGVQAITCFLHACRHQNESKSRKYLAKVLWLLTYDNEQFALAQALDKYCVGVPPIQWLPWIPQLLTCLVRDEGKLVLNLISQVARIFPQAVYFPLRTLYLTLKIEQRERYKTAELAMASANQDQNDQKTSDAGIKQTTTDTNPIRATPSMWRCSRIMQMQREVHPNVLSSLEGIVDQMVCFRENWYEEVLRQSKQGLAKCYAIAFEKRGCVAEATITPHTLNFVNKLVATFGIGVENVNSSVNCTSSSSASVSLARRTQSTIQDPVFQMMKQQFSNDLDFTMPGAKKLQNLIEKLKKWISVLQSKAKSLPKSILIEEKCRFLSNFSQHIAEVELPGEFLLPKHTHYYVKISRFMPRVDIVHKHNTAARRLHIRGHNGKIYPYLVVNDSYIGDARREERVLQLLRMLNHYLGKQKETSSRFLHITVPRVVSVSPQMRLVEDNPASVSLHDIYKEGCLKKDMDHDAPIARYYERLQEVQASAIQPSHHVLKDIFKEIQRKMVPKSMLKEWAMKTFPSTTDYWTFRKMVMLQLSLACFVEYIFHLTRLNPDMMYLHKDSGLINVSYFKFNVDDSAGETDRPVQFRLTPNLTELISDVGVRGPLTASGIAAARCLVQPNFKVKTILRAILRDEMIYKQKTQGDRPENASIPSSDLEGKRIIDNVSQAVNGILLRLSSLAQFEGPDSKMGALVAISTNEDNLCRMDPAWHPWL